MIHHSPNLKVTVEILLKALIYQTRRIWCKLRVRGGNTCATNLLQLSRKTANGSLVIVLKYPERTAKGRTLEECRESLSQAIALILEDRREDGLRGVPQDAIRDTVVVQ